MDLLTTETSISNSIGSWTAAQALCPPFSRFLDKGQTGPHVNQGSQAEHAHVTGTECADAQGRTVMADLSRFLTGADRTPTRTGARWRGPGATGAAAKTLPGSGGPAQHATAVTWLASGPPAHCCRLVRSLGGRWHARPYLSATLRQRAREPAGRSGMRSSAVARGAPAHGGAAAQGPTIAPL